MPDYLDMRLKTLGELIGETKAGGKGGKLRPPWEKGPTDDSTPAEADDATAQAANGKPGGPDRKKRVGARPTAESAMTPKKKAKVGAKGIMTSGRRARITTWGPPQQSVNIRRAEQGVTTGDGDPRVNRVHRQRMSDDVPIRAGGRAGGNGFTRGRSDARAATHKPGNIRGRRGGGREAGAMTGGNSFTRGRSGAAITPAKPANIRKGLYDYSPEQVEAAMGVAHKALGGVLGHLRDR